MNDESAFSLSDRRLADLARALSHPARLAILHVLAARTSCVCGEIVEVMPLAQATVSQHLKVLREVGLVQGTVDGPRTCYGLDVAGLREASAAFGALLGPLAAADPTCACDRDACTCDEDGCACQATADSDSSTRTQAPGPFSPQTVHADDLDP